jgi:hypothetical protein
LFVEARNVRVKQEEGDMRYMLLIFGDEQAALQATAEQREQEGMAYEEFTQSIRRSGNYLDGDPFQPRATATTVRVRDGKSETVGGPVDPSREQLLAYYKVEAGTLDEAVEMASRIPGASYGSIEVRPVLQSD